MKPAHFEILRLHSRGQTNRAVAHRLGVHVNTVSNVIRSDFGRALIAEARERAIVALLDDWRATAQRPASCPQCGVLLRCPTCA